MIGEPVIAAPWDGGSVDVTFTLHRWSHRDNQGLGVTLCGLRQEHRSNAWVFLAKAWKPTRWPLTSMCAVCDRINERR